MHEFIYKVSNHNFTIWYTIDYSTNMVEAEQYTIYSNNRNRDISI